MLGHDSARSHVPCTTQFIFSKRAIVILASLRSSFSMYIAYPAGGTGMDGASLAKSVSCS